MLLAPRPLDRAMLTVRAPADQGVFIGPPLVRQDQAGSLEAGVAIDEENAAAAVQFGSQRCSKFEIARGVAFSWDDLEEQSDHGLTSRAHGGQRVGWVEPLGETHQFLPQR